MPFGVSDFPIHILHETMEIPKRSRRELLKLILKIRIPMPCGVSDISAYHMFVDHSCPPRSNLILAKGGNVSLISTPCMNLLTT